MSLGFVQSFEEMGLCMALKGGVASDRYIWKNYTNVRVYATSRRVAKTPDHAQEILRQFEPGRYHLDKIRANPFPSGHTSRAWGKVIHHEDGQVILDPIPW